MHHLGTTNDQLSYNCKSILDASKLMVFMSKVKDRSEVKIFFKTVMLHICSNGGSIEDIGKLFRKIPAGEDNAFVFGNVRS